MNVMQMKTTGPAYVLLYLASALIAGGISLTSLFTILKLVNLLKWSWPWVICPVWIGVPSAVILGLLAVAHVAFHGRKQP